MTKSVLTRLTPQELLKIRDSVAYDPTVPNGLRWIVKRRGRLPSGECQSVLIDYNIYMARHIVMALNNKWPESDDMVVTRIDSSGSWGDVNNLQWASRQDALNQAHEQNRQKLLASVFGDNVPILGEGLELGKLCKHGHRWNNFDLTLRINGRCADCDKPARQARGKKRTEKIKNNPELKAKQAAQTKQSEKRKRERFATDPDYAERRRTWRRENKQKIRQQLREQGLTSKGTVPVNADGAVPKGERNEAIVLQRKLERFATHGNTCPTVLQLLEEAQRIYWRENPTRKPLDPSKAEERRILWRIRYQLDPDLRLYNREKSKRRKAQLKRQAPSRIPVKALRKRFDQFDGRCAYCGESGDMQIEHVQPVSKGGLHDLANIVPACRSCNYSKHANEMEHWYRSQPFFSELRLAQIKEATHRSNDRQLALALA